jgi:hypothetical protein
MIINRIGNFFKELGSKIIDFLGSSKKVPFLLLFFAILGIGVYIKEFPDVSRCLIIIYNLSESYLSAFIFYLLIVAIPEYKERIIINEQIKVDVERIIRGTRGMFLAMANSADIDIEGDYPTKEEI